MDPISKHISFEEATRSDVAKRYGYPNMPGEAELSRMKELAEAVFEPLRDYADAPVMINSFYRCRQVNTLIGGSELSQHCKGEAMDIGGTSGEKTMKELFVFILKNLEFDQLIWEFGTFHNPDWIHVSYRKGRNRKEVLMSKKEGHKTIYQKFTL